MSDASKTRRDQSRLVYYNQIPTLSLAVYKSCIVIIKYVVQYLVPFYLNSYEAKTSQANTCCKNQKSQFGEFLIKELPQRNEQLQVFQLVVEQFALHNLYQV